MSLENIKTNLWKGADNFSKSWPKMGSIIGVTYATRMAMDVFKPYKKKK